MTPDVSAAPDWYRAALAKQPQSCFIEVAGTQLHFLVWNAHDADKPPLIFAHGYRGHARWWSAIAPYFTDRFRVYALDFSGMGDSGVRPYYDAKTFARDLIGVIQHLGSTPVTVVGHSFGGSITVRACADHPGLIEHAVIVDSYFSFPDDVVRDLPRLISGQVFPEYGALLKRYRLLPRQPVAFPEILDTVAHHSMRQVTAGWRWKFDAELPTVLVEADGYELLARAATRVDIVAGELSIVLSFERAQRVVKILPQGRGPIVIPQAHHHIMLDQPLALISVLRALMA